MFGGIQLEQALRLGGEYGVNVAGVGEEAIGEIHAIGAGRRQALLVALPGEARFDELIGNGLAEGMLGGINGLDPIDVIFAVVAARRASDFVRAVDGRSGRIGAGAVNGADVRTRRAIRIHRTGGKVVGAGGVVPIGIVVAMHAEV